MTMELITGCLPSSETLASLDPRNWNFSDKKVLHKATAIFATCILALIACALIIQYPAVSSALITGFSIVGVGSFVALCIALTKQCKPVDSQQRDRTELLDTQEPNPLEDIVYSDSE